MMLLRAPLDMEKKIPDSYVLEILFASGGRNGWH